MIYDEFIFLNNSTIYVKFASNFAIERISQLLQAKGMRPEIAIKRAISVYGKESEKSNSLFS